MLNFKLDEKLCIRCGKCVADCPPMCITIEENGCPFIPDEKKCIHCQHCLAICPTGAISIMGAEPENSLQLDYELPTAHSMETLIKGRRSTRNYKKKALSPDKIHRLLETSWHAPTGTNAQEVLFTTTMTAEATEDLRREVYSKVGKLLEGMGPDEGDLRHKYLKMSYGSYIEHGADFIMKDAPHMLIASAPKSIPLPKEDCIIALTTFDLLAQTMGVGTVWNGIMTWCVADFFPELAAKLGIPEDHEIGYCMTFGTPAVKYHRTVQRTPAKLNTLDSF